MTAGESRMRHLADRLRSSWARSVAADCAELAALRARDSALDAELAAAAADNVEVLAGATRAAKVLADTVRAAEVLRTDNARLRRDLHVVTNQRLQERAEVVSARTRLLKMGADLAHAHARLERLPTDLDWAAVQADRADLQHVRARRDAELEQLRQRFLDAVAAGHGPTVVLSGDLPGSPAAVLQAQVAAAYAFVDELAGYCSPHGVSARYADRLRQLLDQAAAPQTAGG
jgi:hypothetical protein